MNEPTFVSGCHPTFDGNGNPTDEMIEAIENWPYEDHPGLIAFARAAWHETGRIGDWKSGAVEFVTGGWSGNEAIISAMQRNVAFHLMAWASSNVDGSHVYIIHPATFEEDPCPDCATKDALIRHFLHTQKNCIASDLKIEEALGEALGYKRLDGTICVGDGDSETMATEAAREIKRLRKQKAEIEKFSTAVLLFYRVGPWDDEAKRAWKLVAGDAEATTRTLGNMARALLAETEKTGE